MVVLVISPEDGNDQGQASKGELTSLSDETEHQKTELTMNSAQNKFRAISLVLTILSPLYVSTVLADGVPVTVWKSPFCGCCQGWVDYMKDNGFEVTTRESENMNAIKHELGITDPALHSCHTAKIGDYLIEGHVPVSDIRQLLEEKPDILGLTAPGMPSMSPGMNSIEPKDYDVLQFDEDQNTTLFSRY